MLRIDMTEEPTDDMDLIFKAQNIEEDGDIQYVLPMETEYYGNMYIDVYKYSYLKNI